MKYIKLFENKRRQDEISKLISEFRNSSWDEEDVHEYSTTLPVFSKKTKYGYEARVIFSEFDNLTTASLYISYRDSIGDYYNSYIDSIENPYNAFNKRISAYNTVAWCEKVIDRCVEDIREQELFLSEEKINEIIQEFIDFRWKTLENFEIIDTKVGYKYYKYPKDPWDNDIYYLRDGNTDDNISAAVYLDGVSVLDDSIIQEDFNKSILKMTKIYNFQPKLYLFPEENQTNNKRFIITLVKTK